MNWLLKVIFFKLKKTTEILTYMNPNQGKSCSAFLLQMLHNKFKIVSAYNILWRN